MISATKAELLLISPYFVPGNKGLDFLRGLRARGINITVITNSLAATDVPAVHSGYARYREALLEAGIALWEIKPERSQSKRNDNERQHIEISNALRSSLHAKTFIFDQRELFIGSLNLDPRSTSLNTETGILISNADFAERMNRNIRKVLPSSAYQLHLQAGQLRWTEQTGDGEQAFDHDPETTLMRRIWVQVLALLPIEEQL